MLAHQRAMGYLFRPKGNSFSLSVSLVRCHVGPASRVVAWTLVLGPPRAWRAQPSRRVPAPAQSPHLRRNSDVTSHSRSLRAACVLGIRLWCRTPRHCSAARRRSNSVFGKTKRSLAKSRRLEGAESSGYVVATPRGAAVQKKCNLRQRRRLRSPPTACTDRPMAGCVGRPGGV